MLPDPLADTYDLFTISNMYNVTCLLIVYRL